MEGKARASARASDTLTPGERGASRAPPAYGVDFVDRGSTGGAGLPARLRAGVEALSGLDLSGVRVHTDSSEPARLGAFAFARGREIHLARGQERHLPHEAWHVVQQAQGRVAPTLRTQSGVAVNDDRALEREADVMGRRALQSREAAAGLVVQGRSAEPSGETTLQLAWVPLATAEGRLFVAAARTLAAQPETLAQAKLAEQAVDRAADTNPVLLLLLNQVRDAVGIDGEAQATLRARVAKITANETEVAEGGHSIARHGPELTDDQLTARLYTGVAPDNRLSPAPGSSSRFLSYELLLQTRQAAATALTNDIAACQAAVTHWSLNVLPTLAGVKAQRDLAHDQATVANKQREDALLAHRKNLLGPAKTALDEIDAEITARTEERDTLQHEITTRTTVAGLFGDSEDIDDDGVRDRQTRLADVVLELAALALQRQAPSATHDQHVATETGLEAARNATALTLNTAAIEQAIAADELANPGKNLKKRLKALRTLQLEIHDRAGGTVTMENGVTLLEQYNVIAAHGEDVGSGFENISDDDAVSLTAVLAVAAVNVNADPLVPLARGAIEAGLTGLGLRVDMAPFLTDANNLALVKAKGAMGASVYKRTRASAPLRQTLTNFACGTRRLFDHTAAPIPIVAAGWRAIQHFPTSGETVGVKEHYR